MTCPDCNAESEPLALTTTDGTPERTYECAKCKREWRTFEVETEMIELMAMALMRSEVVL